MKTPGERKASQGSTESSASATGWQGGYRLSGATRDSEGANSSSGSNGLPGMAASSSQNSTVSSSDGDLNASALEKKLDRIIEQNDRMIQILESFTQ
jgi:hypothetical protein